MLRPELERAVERTWPGGRVEALAGDASTRRFWRIHLGGGASRVLMDYGAPFEGTTDDVVLAEIFRAAGLPVARIEAIWAAEGCLVLEDLGDRTLESVLSARPSEAFLWLSRAVDLAARVAVEGTPSLETSARAAAPVLDAARFRFEMDFFAEHYAGALLRGPALPAATLRALYRLADRAADTPRRVLCHRDYHSRNLMVLPDEKLAMVDIQDARWGPDTYDLASLLRDAYVDVDDAWIDPLVARYRAALPRGGAPGFEDRFRVVAVQRMIKALGTFGYQIAVRGNERYRDAIPRTTARLRKDLPRIEGGAELLGMLAGASIP